jgi:hypothetical protein
LEEAKRQLNTAYLNLSPVQINRSLDTKLNKLYHDCEEKGKSTQFDSMRKVERHLVISLYYVTISPRVTQLNDFTWRLDRRVTGGYYHSQV